MSRRPSAPGTRPDLPITPMLDMSFQLMAFFLLTFRPTPTEAMLPLALPAAGPRDEVARQVDPPTPDDDRLTVQVYASANGGVGRVVAALPTGDVPLAADSLSVGRFLKDQKAARGGKAPKLSLEVVDELQYAHVIRLVDDARRAGYNAVSPTRLAAPQS
jgi:biopolymer transport protein ExbD